MELNWITEEKDTNTLPNKKFLQKNIAHLIALGFGTGLSKIAPGTIGTLVAIPFFYLINATNLYFQSLFVIVSFFIGLWSSSIASKSLKLKDPSCIVIDEIVAFLFLLVITDPSPLQIVSLFCLFRAFDIWKPYPISWLEKKYSGGFGIMIDDFAAALIALIFYWLINYAFR